MSRLLGFLVLANQRLALLSSSGPVSWSAWPGEGMRESCFRFRGHLPHSLRVACGVHSASGTALTPPHFGLIAFLPHKPAKEEPGFGSMVWHWNVGLWLQVEL